MNIEEEDTEVATIATATAWSGRLMDGLIAAQLQEDPTSQVTTGPVDPIWAQAILRCVPCPHIASGPQPCFALLNQRTLVCERCLMNARAINDDRCELCDSTGHTTFWPVAAQLGPCLVVGDVGACCRDRGMT